MRSSSPEISADLDPFHPTWANFTIADYHFNRGEYEEAIAAARKLNIPGFYWPPTFLAEIYAELGRHTEARSAVEELRRLYPGFTAETAAEEWQKWNLPVDCVRHWVSALGKAGLPEER